jgi:hypothetical protein
VARSSGWTAVELVDSAAIAGRVTQTMLPRGSPRSRAGTGQSVWYGWGGAGTRVPRTS